MINSENNNLNDLKCLAQVSSADLLVSTKKVNIYATIIIIIIGLIGNGLAVFVFAQKRFRIHSSSIYLLCLAISDGLFLLMHFFEDTLRTYIDVYFNLKYSQLNQECLVNLNITETHVGYIGNFLRTINITDQYDFSCRLVNYFRYFLRFISAYIIVAFTIQRAVAIKWPLVQAKFESNKLAWSIVIILTLVGSILNIWVPFLFKPREEEVHVSQDTKSSYCDIEKRYSRYYFRITISYIILTMLIPIVIIFVANTMIMINIIKASKIRKIMSGGSDFYSLRKRINAIKNSKRFNFNNAETNNVSSNRTDKTIENTPLKNASSNNVNSNEEIVLLTELNVQTTRQSSKKSTNSKLMQRKVSSVKKPTSDSNKITKMLILMSLSYAILNLPYFISWCIFFYHIAFFDDFSLIQKNYLFSALNICEIFYILNYGIHFFVYCASGQKFRSQLRDALKCS